jgi:hypothetical protein
VKYIGDDMCIKIFNEKAEVVGQTLIKISEICRYGTGFDDWLPVLFEGKQIGEIHLKSIWSPHMSDTGMLKCTVVESRLKGDNSLENVEHIAIVEYN